MGRKKLEIKKIEDKNRRHITFSKRRKGLIKKAHEMEVLCAAQVSLTMFSDTGKLYEYCSSSREEIFRRYQSTTKDNAPSEELINRPASSESFSQQLQLGGRRLDASLVNQLNVTELDKLEVEMDSSLRQIRSRKTGLVQKSLTAHEEKEVKLMDEINRLRAEMAARDHQRETEEATRRTLQLFT